MSTPKARFFATPAAWRSWLEKNHRHATELLVGLHKRATGKRSITWPESVDGALSFGWIDGVRRRIDENSYSIRFTPRKRGSTWSAVNVKRVDALREAGLMAPAGERAFAARSGDRTGTYSYEQRQQARLPRPYEARLRAATGAWEFFQSCPPWYRRTATWWVISAKQEATRERRLATLIADSAAGRTIGPLRRKGDTAKR